MARNHTQSLEKEACALRDGMERFRSTADARSTTLLQMSSAMVELTPAARDMSWSHPEAPPRPPPAAPVQVEGRHAPGLLQAFAFALGSRVEG